MKIGIVGGPGCGKSTIASGLFYYLKKSGKSVEIVPELIKFAVYSGEDFTRVGFDIKNTLEQQNLEKIFDAVQGKECDIIIAEAPLCNGWFYSSFYKKTKEEPVLCKIAQDSISSYDRLILVEPNDSNSYETFGRKETKEQSRALSKHIDTLLRTICDESKITRISMNSKIIPLIKSLNI